MNAKPTLIRRTALSGRSEFGDRLRFFRLRRGINAPAFAKELGVAKSSVTNWETGVSFPKQELLPRLCDLLSVSPNALYGFADAEGDLSPEEREALRFYRRLSPLDRKNILSFMRAMLENRASELREECRLRWLVLPRLYDRVCAGDGTELFSDGESEPCFLPATQETRLADAVITVTGNSMEPTFRNGEHLLVRWQKEIRPGEIGVFLVGGQGTVKEYQEDGLHPHNPKYGVIRPREGESILCVGRVLSTVPEEMRPDREHLHILQELFSGGELVMPGRMKGGITP
ncbi:MAG: helix-turn-helix domain-containing protein [Clostridiales bacterium]|nr:helix-turn-helix domain-containing protein [Clostridiales bacterium]